MITKMTGWPAHPPISWTPSKWYGWGFIFIIGVSQGELLPLAVSSATASSSMRLSVSRAGRGRPSTIILSLFDNVSLLLLQLVWVLDITTVHRSFIWRGVQSTHTNYVLPTPIMTHFETCCVSPTRSLDSHFISHAETRVKALYLVKVWHQSHVSTQGSYELLLPVQWSGKYHTSVSHCTSTQLPARSTASWLQWFYAPMASLYYSIPGRCINALVVQINTPCFYELQKIITSERCFIVH